MAAIYIHCIQVDFLERENLRILIPISLKFVPEHAIVHKSFLVQAVALCQTGDKSLPKPMLTKFYDAIWYYHATMR